MALLALRGRAPTQDDPIRMALEYLFIKLTSSRSAYSLAWGVMALGAYGDLHTGYLHRQLESILPDASAVNLPPRILALVALALEDPPFSFREFPI